MKPDHEWSGYLFELGMGVVARSVKQIPCGDDNQKGKGNGKDKSEAVGVRGSRFPTRPTSARYEWGTRALVVEGLFVEAGEFEGFEEDFSEHGAVEAAGEGVAERGVVAAQQGEAVGELIVGAVGELVVGAAGDGSLP